MDEVKLRYKTVMTRQRWRGKFDFYLIGHEHLYVFRKAADEEKTSRPKLSKRWSST